MNKINYNQKPGRPFGLSIAIITSILIFTVLPLLEVAFVISIDQMLIFDEVGRSGLDIIGFSQLQQQIIPQIIFAIFFLIIAIFTWFGKPQRIISWIFSGSIFAIGVLTIVLQILPRFTATTTTLDSSREINQPILIFYLLSTILITLYSVWYVNRWASRAFFRGYYQTDDINEIQRIETEMAKTVH